MGLRDYIRLITGVALAPPNVREIFTEARRRQSVEIEKRNIEAPGWQRDTYDGPDSLAALGRHLDDVAAERGVPADVRKMAKDLIVWAMGERA